MIELDGFRSGLLLQGCILSLSVVVAYNSFHLQPSGIIDLNGIDYVEIIAFLSTPDLR